MLIHRDVLAGVVQFNNQTRSPRSPEVLRHFWVTPDARWLMAANGRQIALGELHPVTPAEELRAAGKLLHGLSLSQAAKNAKSDITFVEIAFEEERAMYIPTRGEVSWAQSIEYMDGNFPDPIGIIEALPIEGALNVASRFAVDGPTGNRIMRAMKGGFWMFSRDKGTWFVSAAEGRTIGDLRILSLASLPASQPHDIRSWRT